MPLVNNEEFQWKMQLFKEKYANSFKKVKNFKKLLGAGFLALFKSIELIFTVVLEGFLLNLATGYVFNLPFEINSIEGWLRILGYGILISVVIKLIGIIYEHKIEVARVTRGVKL